MVLEVFLSHHKRISYAKNEQETAAIFWVKLVLRKNRCYALVQRRRARMLWPLLGRLYGEVEGHLMEELCTLEQSEVLPPLVLQFIQVNSGCVVFFFF